MSWASSNRRAELPPGWTSRIVPRIKRRDHGVCQWPTHAGICGAPGTDVDHKLSPHDHRDEALWLLCTHHHKRKTAGEAAAAREPAVTERRPAERHPGLA